MELTVAELVVLGLVAERPRHGYEVEQIVEQRGIRRWAGIAFSSIYYLLARLERRGLLTAEAGRRSTTARRVLTVTDQGRRAAADAVEELLADSGAAPSAFLAGLANQSLLPGPVVAEALRTRFAGFDARIAVVVAARDAQQPLGPEAHDVFSYSLSQLRAERSWLAERVETPRG